MKSTDKLKNYLETYTRERYFIDRVLEIRKEIGIPKNGIKMPNLSGRVIRGLPASLFGIKYKNTNHLTFPKQRTKIYSEILEPIPEIYKNVNIILFINIFILYNERKYDVFTQFYNSIEDTVSFNEYRLDFLERRGCCDCDVKVCEDFMDETSKKYPIMIGISPYATQNEAIDLIKKRWDYIQMCFVDLEKRGRIEVFAKEKISLAKIRSRKTKSKEIEDLVYDNRSLSLKLLRGLVNEKTGELLDDGEIGKLRSLAIKRRESRK